MRTLFGVLLLLPFITVSAQHKEAMALSQTVLEEIEVHVKSGFESPDETLRVFTQDRYAPGELDPELLRQAIASANAQRIQEMKQWPKVTDVDKLIQAFERISKRGVIAMHNAGFTQSDGYEDFLTAYDRHQNPKSVRGYCFYSSQDLEAAIKDRKLDIAFGPANPRDEATVGLEVGRIVVDELRKSGLRVKWDGTFNRRIRLPGFDWKKR